jgi:hypothetical protein
VHVGLQPSNWSLATGQMSDDNATVTVLFDNGVKDSGVLNGCRSLMWSSGDTWLQTSLVKRVHLIAMWHLDVGYNGLVNEVGFINNVLNKYFTEYFPRSIAISKALIDLGGPERYILTTHPWLVSLYLDCPTDLVLAGIVLQCPDTHAQQAFRDALRAGWLVMHAAPMNPQWGNAQNGHFIDAMLNVAKSLSAELGIAAPFVASLRDVPGTTRSLIPHLVRNNISALTIGVNDFSPSPLLPNPGVWIEPSTNTSIIIMRTPQSVGYPDNAGPDPSNPGGLSRHSCVETPALPDQALCWMFRTDNSGPPESIQEVLQYFDTVRWQFPGAMVQASTHEAFVTALETVRDQLPTCTSEAGETWLLGIPSDPWKVAYQREAVRAYSECLETGVFFSLTLVD